MNHVPPDERHAANSARLCGCLILILIFALFPGLGIIDGLGLANDWWDYSVQSFVFQRVNHFLLRSFSFAQECGIPRRFTWQVVVICIDPPIASVLFGIQFSIEWLLGWHKST